MDSTPRLGMPFLSAGQAQKEIFHNEALQIVDLVAAGAVEEAPRSDPPASPSLGSCYIIGASPTGVWAGKSHSVAGYTRGGWRLIEPTEGMSLYVKSDARWATYRAGAWEIGLVRGSSVIVDGQQVLGPRAPAISSPSGGTTIDIEARNVIGTMLDAMRAHGLIES
jgi:hypothetical protein